MTLKKTQESNGEPTVETEMQTCGTCRFQALLVCHRFPPHPEGGNPAHPRVSISGWCGEWKKRE